MTQNPFPLVGCRAFGAAAFADPLIIVGGVFIAGGAILALEITLLALIAGGALGN